MLPDCNALEKTSRASEHTSSSLPVELLTLELDCNRSKMPREDTNSAIKGLLANLTAFL